MILEQIRNDIRAHLLARDYFQGIDIVLPVKGMITSDVEQTVAALKLCILIEIRRGKILTPDLGSSAADLTAVLTIQENVTLNRPDPNEPAKTADEVLEELFAALSPLAGQAVPCIAQDFEQVSNRGEYLAYEVSCSIQAGWQKT